MQDELGFPDKRDANKWSVSEALSLMIFYAITWYTIGTAARYALALSGAWSGNPSCTEASCEPDATLSKCQSIGFTE